MGLLTVQRKRPASARIASLLSRGLAGSVVFCGCTTPVTVDLAVIDSPRLLAVAATPAEGEPGAEVMLTALVVDEDGARPDDALAWSVCTARRPLAELGPVAPACLDDDPDVDLGIAPTAMGVIPDEACRLFGPDPPPAEPGEPAGRPVEPDQTGGYYQPIVVARDDEQAVYGVRLDCGVAGATQAQAAELRMRHRNNVSPVAELLRGETVIESAVPLVVEAGDEIDLRARWAACEDDVECTGAESYARFDPITLEIVESREAIGIAWYATGGTFADARTGRDAEDSRRTSDNTWTAPDDAGDVTMWIVIRDDRGGVSWTQVAIDVE
jgi:hypothetical protein